MTIQRELPIAIGSKAPKFNAPDQDGKVRTLSEFKGKKLVLYFYPKDDTPGCTAEACDLRDNYKKFIKAGYSILGVSIDSEKRHRNFIAKYQLPFDLLADTEHIIAEVYGVWAEKRMFGKKYMGIVRTTFIIDEKGKIEDIILKVDTANHAAQIL